MRHPQALYWDSEVQNNGATYSSSIAYSAERSAGIVRNVRLMLDYFDQVRTYATFGTLAEHLFACSSLHDRADEGTRRCSPLVVFVTTRNDDDDTTNDKTHDPNASNADPATQILRYLGSQFAHTPVVVVLSDRRPQWALYNQYGADTVPRALARSDLQRVTARARQIQVLLRSRSMELRATLGMCAESLRINPMGRFFMAGRALAFNSCRLGDLYEADQVQRVTRAVGAWDFYAHELSADELVLAAVVMFQHAFAMFGAGEEDAEYTLSEEALITLVMVLRDSYHASNPYHNFRHAIDVLQATFYFSIAIGALPAVGDAPTARNDDIFSRLEALTLLIVAIGHDVGHPGVTNAFLVSCHAPIAQIYNDRSVLESFHSAAFTQILRQHWPKIAALKPTCNTIIDSVLATDMAVHFDYMCKLKALPRDEVLRDKTLLSCIIIKSADISNVARHLDISTKWGQVLAEEFAEVANLEVEFGLKAHMAAPKPESKEQEAHMLAKGQLFFIETYATPLFEALASVFPQLQFTTGIIADNALTWKQKLAQ